MIKTKLNGDKKAIIVKKVCVPETLRNIPHGTKGMRFSRKELSNRESTIASAVYRLNNELGCNEFSFVVDPDDGSFLISRL